MPWTVYAQKVCPRERFRRHVGLVRRHAPSLEDRVELALQDLCRHLQDCTHAHRTMLSNCAYTEILMFPSMLILVGLWSVPKLPGFAS